MKISKPLRRVFAAAAFAGVASCAAVGADMTEADNVAAPVPEGDQATLIMSSVEPHKKDSANRHESFEAIMKAIGVPANEIKRYNDMFMSLVGGISKSYVNRQKADPYVVHGNVLSGMNDALEKNPKATLEELVDAGFDKALHALDPHSDYMNAEELDAMSKAMSGQFAGIGINMSKASDDAPVVIEKLINDETPAAKAGLKPGDKITHINGTSLIGMSMEEAMKAMAGKKGSEAVLTIEREGSSSPMDIHVIRDIIPMSPVMSDVLDDDIGYIRLSTFSGNADEEMDKAINQIENDTQGKVKSYILDLRFNGGGRVDQAAEIVDNFIHSGKIVSALNDKGEGFLHRAEPGDMLNGKPLVVLVNGYSASASEIVAGSLQDHGRAKIIGSQTFGKGSVQNIFPLNMFQKQTAIKLTTALYYTASGRSIQNVGVTPDIRTEFALKGKVKEAGLDQTIANPKGTNANGVYSSQTCGKTAAFATADPAKVDADFVVKQRDGSQRIDYDLICAVEALKGDSYSPYVRIQDNKPAAKLTPTAPKSVPMGPQS